MNKEDLSRKQFAGFSAFKGEIVEFGGLYGPADAIKALLRPDTYQEFLDTASTVKRYIAALEKIENGKVGELVKCPCGHPECEKITPIAKLDIKAAKECLPEQREAYRVLLLVLGIEDKDVDADARGRDLESGLVSKIAFSSRRKNLRVN